MCSSALQPAAVVQSGETIVVETATQHAGDDYDKVHGSFMAFSTPCRCSMPRTLHSIERLLRLQELLFSHLSSWSTDCACQDLAYTDAGTLQMVKGDPAMEDVYEWTAKQINVPFRGRTGILNPSAVAPIEILILACGGHMGFPCRSAHCIEATM